MKKTLSIESSTRQERSDIFNNNIRLQPVWIITIGMFLILLIAKPATAAWAPYFRATERLSLINSGAAEDTKLDLFMDDQERLYILDFKANQIYIVTAEGRTNQKIFRFSLNLPTESLTKSPGLWVRNGIIYIKPTNDHFVWLYNTQGQLVRKISLKVPQDYSVFIDMAVDQRGYLYLLESVTMQVEVFDEDGNFVGIFVKNGRRENDLPGSPECIFLDNEGSFYFSVRIPGIEKSQLFKYSYQGRKMVTFSEPPAHHYTNICTDKYQNLFAIAPDESLVVKFDRWGRKICQFQVGCASGMAVAFQGKVYLDSGKSGLINVMYPATMIRLIDRGNEFLLDGRWDEAVRYFEKARILDNQVEYIHSILGEVYFHQRQWFKAMDEFKYLKDNWRYSQALTSFRNEFITNFWPHISAGLLIVIFLIAWLLSILKKLTFPRWLSFLKVIWNPQTAFQTESTTTNPAIAWLYLILFTATRYFSWYYTNPIFVNERQVFSLQIFGRELAVILALVVIWSGTAYKIGELFQGLAKYSQLFNGTAICLVPLIIGEPVLAALSHLLTYDEYWIYQWLSYLLTGWVILLFILKIRFTEVFEWSKTLGVGLVNLAATALVLIFLGFLVGINQQLISFLGDIFKELYTRFTT